MFYYRAFGLNINSEFELFQLTPRITPTKSDVDIIEGPVLKEGISSADQPDIDMTTSERKFQISIGGVARFLICGGTRITVDMDEDVDLQTVKLYLLGSCIGAILQQRGDLVLHGNAIRFGDKAVLVVAQTGVGKSTLAAEFLRRGYQLLADDVCAIDQHGCAQPSYPYIKLWQAALDKLKFDKAGLIKIRLQKEKFYLPLKEAFYQESLPVSAIYVLNKHDSDDFKCIKLRGLEKLKVLRNNTYLPSYAKRFRVVHIHMEKFAKMLQSVELTRITRPAHGFKLEELAQLIIDQHSVSTKPSNY